MAVAEIIAFATRKPKIPRDNNLRIIRKVVDGEIIECVNIDELPPDQQSEYLALDERT